MHADKQHRSASPASDTSARRQPALDVNDRRSQTAVQTRLLRGIRQSTKAPGPWYTAGTAVQRHAAPNRTGLPDPVKQRMEAAFGSDFSSVRVHPGSPSVPRAGALAYTRGTDIHFAPGQFKPDTPAGQRLLGHELAHVVQQQEGRVQPTTIIGGMPVNDDPALEHEADTLGNRAAGSGNGAVHTL